MRIGVLFPLVLLIFGGCPAVLSPDALYEVFADNPAVRLPVDESPHAFGGYEWWYYTGLITAEDDRQFGIEAVVFFLPEQPIFPWTEAWGAHYAVIDLENDQFTYDQYRRFEHADFSDGRSGGFDVGTSLVSMSGSNGSDVLSAKMTDGEFALDLQLTDSRGPVFHGDGGYVVFGDDGHSFYYSRPRMEAVGTFVVDGEELAVTGEFWFDRQWGIDLVNPWQSWEWLSLRLDDGRDIVLFTFDGDWSAFAFGTVIWPDGSTASLTTEDIEVEALAVWTSPQTQLEYAVAWDVSIPSIDLDVTVEAIVEEAELDGRATTLNIYWEGICEVRDDTDVCGYAYVELANQW